MSYRGVLIQFCIVFSVLTLNVECNTCKEDNEFYITCKTFEDLFSYPNPEKQESVTVQGDSDGGKNKEIAPFVCDEPMFKNFTTANFVTLNHARVLHISSDCFEGLDAIKAIELQGNDLTSIDMESFRTSDEMQLRAIYLSNNHIVKIDFSTVDLPELTQFEAYSNRVKSVKLRNENLPKIANMYLGYNQITRFQIESQSMGKLDLSYNRIASFKGTDLALPNLYILYLNDNAITTMTPDMLENMPNLENIYLAHNLLKTVSFPTLKKANYVDLRYNRVKNIESVNLTTLGQEYFLGFDSNKIFQLESDPQDESLFENLTHFTCDSCYIHIIEPFFIANTFKKIESLTLTSNFLRTANIFQSKIGDLKLISVALSFNKIKKIGKRDFKRLTAVTSIQLDNNDIATIAPGAFDTLRNLETIGLENNVIFQLPANLFERTTSLTVLSLSGNNMAFFNIPGWQEATGKIDSSNSMLNKLNTLNIQKNPLQCQCIELIRYWAKWNNIYLRIDDENVRNGVKPSCIVNDEGCKTDVGKNYVKDYWHLFNDKKVSNLFGQDEDEDEEK